MLAVVSMWWVNVVIACSRSRVKWGGWHVEHIRLIQELSFQKKKNSLFMFPPSYNLVDTCNCKRLCWLLDSGSYWAGNQDFTLNFVWFDHTFLKYIHTDLVLVAHLTTIPADGFNADTIMQQTWQQTNIINQWQSLYFVGILVPMRLLDGFF